MYYTNSYLIIDNSSFIFVVLAHRICVSNDTTSDVIALKLI
jgi:hypothetical protein